MAKNTEALVTLNFTAKGLAALNKATASIGKVTKASKKQADALNKINKGAGKAAKANSKLKDTMRNLASSIAVVDGPLGGIASRFNAFGTIIGRVNKNMLATAAGFIALTAGARIGLIVFGEMERNAFRLGVVLKNTGRTGATSVEKLTEAARKLGEETLTSREAALEAVATLASFKNIPTSKLEELLVLSQDLSVILGGDLKQNAALIGRAFNDVGGAAEFLRRKGLQLTDAQKAQIETWVANGEQLKAITFLQKELANISGVAAAEAKGLMGVMDTLGEVARSTAEEFVKQTGITDLFKAAVIALTESLRFLSKHMDTIAASLKALFIIFSIKSIASLITAVGGIVTVVKALTKAVFGLSVALLTNPIGLLTVAIIAASGALVLFKDELLQINGVVFSVGSFAQVVFADIDRIIQNTIDRLIIAAEVIKERLGLLKRDLEGLGTINTPGDFARSRLAADAKLDIPFTNLASRAAAMDAGKDLAEAFSDGFNQRIVNAGLLGGATTLQGILGDPKTTPEPDKDLIKRLEQLQKQADALKIQEQINALLISGEEKLASVAALVVKFKNENVEAARKILQESIKLQRSIERQNEVIAAQKEIVDRNKREWDQVNGAVKETFSSIIRGSDTALGALGKLADKLADIVLQSAFASINLQSLFGGGGGGPFDFLGSLFGSAQGNAFNNGSHITKYAKGGVVSSPTLFPMRGSSTGLMGEEGPEAILPLTRTSGGDLGVKAVGGGGAGIQSLSMPVSVSVNIEGGQQGSAAGGDPEEAKRLGNVIGEAVRVEVFKVIDRESRSGGRLSPASNNGRLA